MEPIESEIKLLFNEINNLIEKNPNQSIKSFYDDKEIELYIKNNISETYNHKINGQVSTSNSNVYKVLNVVKKKVREIIRKRQLKFTGHCISMPTDEPINRFSLYESKDGTYLRPGAPTRAYRQLIWSHLLPGEKALDANEIWKIAMNKSAWNKYYVVSKKKKPPDLSSDSDDDDEKFN